MFSRFLGSTVNFLSRSSSLTPNPETASPAGQDSEQPRFAGNNNDMVTTRRQEMLAQSSQATNDASDSSLVKDKKRKASDDEIPAEEGWKKRRVSGNDRVAGNGTREVLDSQDTHQDTGLSPEILDNQNSEQQKLVIRPHSPVDIPNPPQTEQHGASHDDTKALSMQENKTQGDAVIAESLELSTARDESSSAPIVNVDSTVIVKKPEQDQKDTSERDSETLLGDAEVAAVAEEEESQVLQDPVKQIQSSPVQSKSKSKHKRFGDEDPIIPETQLPEEISIPQPNGDADLDREEETGSSDDEAPEEVTAATGQGQARAAAAVAEKAAKRQTDIEKEKRRKKDTELKKQAKVARKQKQNQRESKPSLAKQLLESGELPDELPEELFAEDSEDSEEQIPLQNDQKKILNNKRKLLDADKKPPKDIRYGNKMVRVLPGGPTTLPPKVSKNSAQLREAWLMGRRGKGSNAEKRQSMKRGFVVK